ncbi:class II histocompatibility antigen, B-L beta chain-like isoform X1 [Phasianus colchicus]|uniref:class II histocompatibility antigen, B-L beta chain-like isoform X1 n=1 Tax=Phasianus colchicus TaxID=9054 RepID=UPI00129DC85F|nr:class II histocompatibility antigen, B-L beta chain-like isoform X1 [Phasianus colchicus]
MPPSPGTPRSGAAARAAGTLRPPPTAAMGSGRVLAAGAVLVALAALGARLAAGTRPSGERGAPGWGRCGPLGAPGLGTPAAGWGRDGARPGGALGSGEGRPRSVPLRLPAAFFQWSATVECRFLNGTERTRFVVRHVYNRQQYVHFDSDVGLFVADAVLGEPAARLFNGQPDVLEKNRAAAEMLCGHNHEIALPLTLQKREPKVRIRALRSGSPPQTERLACYVTGFYPPEIDVKWFHNGREETERVASTGVIQNGDWTYQVLLVLEAGPRLGDGYVCRVQHVSLRQPVSRLWEPPLDAGRSKLLLGVGGFVLGLVYPALGLFVFLRWKKGRPDPSAPGDFAFPR